MKKSLHAIKVRVVVDIELTRGTTMVEAAEVAESLPAVLLQNAEVEDAELTIIERRKRV